MRTENKTIRIDLEVYDEIKKRAKPFSDTPNIVLRRVFNLTKEGES